MRPQVLSEEECRLSLANLVHWEIANRVLWKVFAFQDFKTAFQFMTQVAEVAEKLNHHPDWQQNYSQVIVWLTTHDQGGLTSLDFRLARHMDKIDLMMSRS